VWEERVIDVWFLIDSLGTGGAERSTALILPHLRERGVEPRVIVLRSTRQGSEDEVRAAGIDLLELSGNGLTGRVRELRRLLLRERPSLLHTALFLSDQVGRLAGVRTRTRVISTLVNMPRSMRPVTEASPPAWKTLPLDWFDRLTAYTMVTQFQAVTEGVKFAATAARRAPAERITVVERGRDGRVLGSADAERRAQVRETLGLSADNDLVLAVGRCEAAKDYPNLLRAIAMLVESRPKLILAIAGRPGGDSAEIDALLGRDSLLRSRVRLLGQRTDVGDLLNAADLFVLSSRYEGAAGALLEAMHSKTPIVATEVAGLQGILAHGRNCLAVPVARPDRLADAIDLILDNRALAARLVDGAAADFEERFTIECAADRLVDFYRAVLAR